MKRQKNKRQIKHIISERTPESFVDRGLFLQEFLKMLFIVSLRKVLWNEGSFIRKTRILLTSK